MKNHCTVLRPINLNEIDCKWILNRLLYFECKLNTKKKCGKKKRSGEENARMIFFNRFDSGSSVKYSQSIVYTFSGYSISWFFSLLFDMFSLRQGNRICCFFNIFDWDEWREREFTIWPMNKFWSIIHLGLWEKCWSKAISYNLMN